jgi:hypothetical protein
MTESQTKSYTVINSLGVFADGQRAETGQTIHLEENTATPLLAAGAIQAEEKPKLRTRAKK